MAKIGIDVRKYLDYGIGTYIQKLVELSMDEQSVHEWQSFGPRELVILPGFPRGLRHHHLDAGKYSLAEMLAFHQPAKREKLDLLHFPHYLLPFGIPCKTVVTMHDPIHLLFPQDLPFRHAKLYARWMMQRVLKKADGVITVSETSKQDFQELFPGSGDRIRVIHNGVDPLFRQQEPVLARESLMNRLQAEGKAAFVPILRDVPFFLVVGALAPRKNILRILEAFRELHLQGETEAHLVFAGELPSKYPRVDKADREHPFRDKMHFLGFVEVETLRDLYNACIGLVFPSIYEGFGLPAMEAMACGTPVIASRRGSLPEIIGEDGLFVDPYNTNDLTEVMAGLESNEELRSRLSAHGLQRVKLFTWERCRAETLAFYNELL